MGGVRSLWSCHPDGEGLGGRGVRPHVSRCGKTTCWASCGTQSRNRNAEEEEGNSQTEAQQLALNVSFFFSFSVCERHVGLSPHTLQTSHQSCTPTPSHLTPPLTNRLLFTVSCSETRLQLCNSLSEPYTACWRCV